jgi:hypothetical protein
MATIRSRPDGSSVDKSEVLKSLEQMFDVTNAERESPSLSTYFVETKAWDRLVKGRADIVKGVKGSGKSALYQLLRKRQPEMAELQRVLIVAAEEPLGTSVFGQVLSQLQEDSREASGGHTGEARASASHAEFSDLWRLYFLVLILGKIRDLERKDAAVKARLKKMSDYGHLVNALRHASLLAKDVRSPFNLGQTLTRVMQAVHARVKFVVPGFEAELQADGAKGQAARAHGSTHELFGLLQGLLDSLDLTAWVIIDRLDDAFENQSSSLEAIGLNTLLKTYKYLDGFSRIRLKIFVRSDIFTRILADPFADRNLEKIEAEITIAWEPEQLVDLVIRRMLQSTAVHKLYRLSPEQVHACTKGYLAQRQLFDRIFPPRIDDMDTLLWICSQLENGSGDVTPRTFLKVVHFAIERQDDRRVDAEGEALVDVSSLKWAQARSSEEYYTKAFRAEHATLRDFAQALHGCHAGNTLGKLHAIWMNIPRHHRMTLQAARQAAIDLTESGFFSQHKADDGYHWVAPLYRAALDIKPGSSLPEKSDRDQVGRRL